jgi:ABC-type multidrug transport system fused ATPase/permease subunit
MHSRLFRRLIGAKRFLGISNGAVAFLATAGVAAAMAEATVLYLVLQAAEALSRQQRTVAITLGPIRAEGVSLGIVMGFGLLAIALRFACQSAAGYVPARLAANVQARLRRAIYSAYADASWDMQARESEGRLHHVTTFEVTQSAALALAIAGGVSNLVSFLILILAALLVNWVAAAFVVVGAAVLFVFLRPLAAATRKAANEAAAANSELSRGLLEAIRLGEEAYAFGVRDAQSVRIARLVDELRRPLLRSDMTKRLVAPIHQAAAMALVVLGLFLVSRTSTGNIGSFASVVLLLVRSMSYNQQLQATYHSIVELVPRAEVIQAALAEYGASAAPRGSLPIERIECLELRDVSFAYDAERPVLNRFSLKVRMGSAVALVGRSGIGKSTVIHLVLGLRAPQSGVVLANDIPISEYDSKDWYSRIGYVPQESRLVENSVRENIRFYRSWISDAAIEEAAGLAHIHDEIMMMSNGYESLIGPRSSGVSGGQRQRIALARAIAGAPDLLVLDEPTSSLDARSERLIRESLVRLKPTTAILLVAHRDSTIGVCDEVVELSTRQEATTTEPVAG